MSSQRGAAGVVIAIIVGLLVIGGGGYWIFKGRGAAQTKVATSTPESAEEGSDSASRNRGAPTIQRYVGTPMQNPPPLLSIIPVDKNLSKNQTAVFYTKSSSAGTGIDSSAYVQINIPNPEALVRIYPNPSSDQPVPGALSPANTYSPPSTNNTAYYTDSQNIYVLEDSSSGSGGGTVTLTIVQASDPATFQLLSDVYAKDSQHVYLIVQVCDGQGVCTQGLTIIEGADPATFIAFEPSVVEQSDGTGTVTIDAIDINSEYFGGVVVDTVTEESAVYKKYYGTPDPNGLILLAP